MGRPGFGSGAETKKQELIELLNLEFGLPSRDVDPPRSVCTAPRRFLRVLFKGEYILSLKKNQGKAHEAVMN